MEYDNYCATCFKNLFPKDPRVKAYGFKEQQTKTFIDANFPGFRHNSCIEADNTCDCTVRRSLGSTGHRTAAGPSATPSRLICVETDELAHTGYSVQDERDRYHDVIMGWGRKLIFIRFNPDGKGAFMEDKLARLAEEIHKQIRRVEAEENTDPQERYYLFYPATKKTSLLTAAQ